MKNIKRQKFVLIIILILLVIFLVLVGLNKRISKKDNNVQFSVTGNTLQVMEDSTISQTITVGEGGIFALSLNKIPAFIIDKDVNFDGYNDVGVITSTGYAGLNNFYDFYIYNPTSKKLEKSPILVGIVPTTIDPVKKEIISNYKSGAGYVTTIFQWDGTGYTKIEK